MKDRTMSTQEPDTVNASDEKLKEPMCERLALGEYVVGGLTRARRAFGDWPASASSHARKAAMRADETVHHHPYRVIGVVGIAALLAGILASRR
jgi:ElaB/YqjD/DUF883 family membrane-anchored ribosome-binding protein